MVGKHTKLYIPMCLPAAGWELDSDPIFGQNLDLRNAGGCLLAPFVIVEAWIRAVVTYSPGETLDNWISS